MLQFSIRFGFSDFRGLTFLAKDYIHTYTCTGFQMSRHYEFRDPIHGFILVNEWERSVIDHPAFQRLRRIRQLGWTDYVYPSATHSRFEHCLGVMHIAGRVFDALQDRAKRQLEDWLSYDEAGFLRDRQILRFAALLHDVGHPPFSHASDELFPKQYSHEDYSAEIIRRVLKARIEEHPANRNYNIQADDVADLLSGGIPRTAAMRLFWRSLVTGNLDADRADYLLRDSYFTGTAYGRYDLERLIRTLTVTLDREGNPVLAVEEGGGHAAEGLIIARYFMFTQVYFHRTRRAFDHHNLRAMKKILGGKFPAPTSDKNLKEYLKWDDWEVRRRLMDGKGEDHGKRLLERNHFRCVYETSEVPSPPEIDKLDKIARRLGNRVRLRDRAEKSWYKPNKDEVLIVRQIGRRQEARPLSEMSSVIRGLKPVEQQRLYVDRGDVTKSLAILETFIRNAEARR